MLNQDFLFYTLIPLMSQKLKFIWVGKLKKKFWQEAAAIYWSRLKRFYRLEEITVKDALGNQPLDNKIAAESKKISQKITGKDLVILLDDKGKQLSTSQLAKQLHIWIDTPGTYPCFVLGGAYGVDQTLHQRSDFNLGLSRLTFPHELARILLLEQLYRATTILKGHPYHH